RNLETYIGGSSQRAFLGATLLAVALGISVLSRFLVPGRAGVLMSWSGTPLVLGLWLLPWANWLPGTAIYADNPSFAARYAAEISLAGLCATILAFIVGTWLTIRCGKRIEPVPTAPSSKDSA
ncbi:MAG: hypothetical protein ABI779_10610, partial [Acidobacteriota bacterium]